MVLALNDDLDFYLIAKKKIDTLEIGIVSVSLVPKLWLGNSVLEARASRFAKLELWLHNSQSGDWEPAETSA